jgi:glycosyltransferase involved in cell wall biosynthesis
MRVLLVSGTYPPVRCGVGDYTAGLARAFGRREDVTVSVLTSSGAAGAREERVELFPEVRTWKIADSPLILRRIRGWCPDIVHIQYPTLYYGEIQWILPALARLVNGPVVQTWHEYYSPRNWPSVLNAALPGGLVVVRPHYRERMPRWYRWLIRHKEFRFIPNASSIPLIRLSGKERTDVRSEVGAHEGDLIVYFGFASPAKGIELLFKVADPERHRLVLICDLSAEDRYQASILALASRSNWAGKVTVTGFLPPEQAGRLLAAADAAVFPFLDGGGEWNSSIHGAAAQGTFVLATSLDRRGYDAVKNIYYAVPGDIEEMRQALREHLGRRRTPSADSPEAQWDSIAEAHLELYRILLGRPGEASPSVHGGGGDR